MLLFDAKVGYKFPKQAASNLHKYLFLHNKEFDGRDAAETLVGGHKEHGTNSTEEKDNKTKTSVSEAGSK